MKYKLSIKLNSDLATSSGTGFGSLIDADVCYDENGFPYIPAKRLKGLLREASLEYCEWSGEDVKKLDEIYGKEGMKNSCPLKISDAYLANYDLFLQDLNKLPKKFQKYMTKQKIIDLFTYTRHKTAIDEETGSGKENSLRSIRVVRKNNEFTSLLEIDTSLDKSFIEDSLKFLKHIGMNRTRGFGEITCKLEEISNEESMKTFKISNDDEEYVEIQLLFKAKSKLMVSKKETEISEKYIAGSNILGNIAKKYIEDHHIQDFENLTPEYIDLFLNGKVKYHNCYISNQEGLEFIPIPFSYAKVKGKKNEFYNKLFEINQEGIQLTNIGDKYIHLETERVMDVIMTKSYHHQRPKDKSIGKAQNTEDGGTLYQYTSIDKNQYFLGKIVGQVKYLKQIEKYLNIGETFYVGKSKTAEYGRLVLEKITVNKINNEKKLYKDFAVVLTSDVILLNQSGEVTIAKNDFVDKMKELLGTTIQEERAFINYSEASGYNILWNLPKEQLSSFKAGSIFKFSSADELMLEENYTIGQRTNEGYGNIRIIDLTNQNENLALQNYQECQEMTTLENINKELLKLTEKSIVKSIDDAILNEVTKQKFQNINNSTIGRLLLMLKQSKTKGQFLENVKSIKDKKKLETIQYLLKNVNSQLQILTDLQEVEMICKTNVFSEDEYYLKYVKQILIQMKIEGMKAK